MKLFKQILKFKNSDEFLKDYKKNLDEFLSYENLNEYLDSPLGKKFFVILAKNLELSDFFIDQKLKEFLKFKLQKGYILVDTSSKKTVKLFLEDKLIEGDFYENLSLKIQNHFKNNSGFLGDFGQILAYQVFVFDSILLFDVNGNFILNLPNKTNL